MNSLSRILLVALLGFSFVQTKGNTSCIEFLSADSSEMFVGVYNKVKLNCDCKNKFELTSKVGRTLKLDSTERTYSLFYLSKCTDTLHIICDEVEYLHIVEVSAIPNFSIRIGDSNSNTVNLESLVPNPNFKVICDSCSFRPNMVVRSFELFTISNNDTNNVYPFQDIQCADTFFTIDSKSFNKKVGLGKFDEPQNRTRGSQFTETQVNQLSKLKKGDKVLITNVIVSSGSSSSRILNDTEFVVH